MQVGPMVCHVVWYERLVLQPRAVMRGVLAFLNLAWSETVLHHEAAIGSRIQLSPWVTAAPIVLARIMEFFNLPVKFYY